MNAPLLSELREPPVVGRFYMVPAVRFPWHNLWGFWPVVGPLHEDKRFFDFSRPHYHIDTRFLTAAQWRKAARVGETYLLGEIDKPYFVERAVGSYPLDRTDMELPRGRPALVRRRCRANAREYAFSDMKPVEALNRHFSGRKKAAEPIRLADGRLLCPHRKADLSTYAPDANGIVVCPLHGLRVRCASKVAA